MDSKDEACGAMVGEFLDERDCDIGDGCSELVKIMVGSLYAKVGD